MLVMHAHHYIYFSTHHSNHLLLFLLCTQISLYHKLSR